MIRSPQGLRLGRRFTFQQVNNAKHNTGGLRDNSECPREARQNPDWNPIRYFWRDLRIYFYGQECQNIPQSRPAESGVSYTRHLEALPAEERLFQPIRTGSELELDPYREEAVIPERQ